MAAKKVPENELDRSILALGRSQSALPRFMRALGAGELWFLMVYQPEIEGETLEMKNGMRSPFAQFSDNCGNLVPIFSSRLRAAEALRAGQVKPKTFSAASMEAVLLLEVLATMNLRVVLNKSCKTGEVELPQNMMRDVADGSAFETAPVGPRTQGPLSMIDPADYPTDLMQPVFELLRRHRNFRAAWIFHHGDENPTTAGGRHYQFIVHMDPGDETVLHDFMLVLASVCTSPDEADCGCLTDDDAVAVVDLWRQVKPFYVAPDHQAPGAS